MTPAGSSAQVFDFLKIAVPVLMAVVGWWATNAQRLRSEERVRREETYRVWLCRMDGLYKSTEDREKKRLFLEQYRLAWLSCPDDVIQKANAFLATIESGSTSANQKEEAMGDLLVAIRNDMRPPRFFVWSRNDLKGSDFRHYTPS